MATFKLYPPVIGSRIPAFYQDSDDNLIITVPFVNNRSVSFANINSIVLRLKTVQTDWVNIDFYFPGTRTELREAWDEGIITYKIPKNEWQKGETGQWKFNVGQFYKVQLAYLDTDEQLGYFSSVGISKFSFYPDMSIEGLETHEPNTHKYNYIGKYSQLYNDKIMDITEKVYYYKFIITQNSTVIKDTDWLLHNSDLDENEYSSIDKFEYLSELSGNCLIQYLVKTSSGIQAASPKYPIKPAEDIQVDTLTCTAENHFDNGYVEIAAQGTLEADEYYVVRNKVGSNDKYKISKISLNSSIKDFTVEQGEEYEYRIYALINDSYSYSESVTVLADYEDIFIYDGIRQLKVRFNPSVNSMNQTIMEEKLDTIGGKYPIFSRNGDTRYFSFGISGLVTFNMDEEGLFDSAFAMIDLARESTNTEQSLVYQSFTSQTASNYRREREFREKVLDWLNDGNPKLFRSPSEGIKIVRLMNNSMTPRQEISRMVYTFNSTLIESDNHDYEALVRNKIYRNV